MKYSNLGNKSTFKVEEDNLYEVRSTGNHSRDTLLTDLVFSLLRVKAIHEYFMKSGSLEDEVARQEYDVQMKNLWELYRECFVAGDVKEIPIGRISQKDLKNKFKSKNIGFIERACASILHPDRVRAKKVTVIYSSQPQALDYSI